MRTKAGQITIEQFYTVVFFFLILGTGAGYCLGYMVGRSDTAVEGYGKAAYEHMLENARVNQERTRRDSRKY